MGDITEYEIIDMIDTMNEFMSQMLPVISTIINKCGEDSDIPDIYSITMYRITAVS